MKTPISVVKDKFGDKSKLVAAVEKFTGDDLWVARTNANKGLAHVSNAKLLRLHATFTAVKEKFGTRAKLIDAICDLEKRTKDDGFKKRISGRTTHRRASPRRGQKPAGPTLDGGRPDPRTADLRSALPPSTTFHSSRG